MADAVLRVIIDGSGARTGAVQVVRSLEDIRAKAKQTVDELGKVGPIGGTAQFAASASATGRSLSDIRERLDNTSREFVGARAASSAFFADTQSGSARLIRLSQDLEGLGSATTHAGGKAGIATREFRALFDELTAGRTRMVPGTLAIIATNVLGISGATLAWVAGIAAIPIAYAAAAFSAERSLDNIRAAVHATGEAAGVTAGKINEMAKALDRTSHLSISGAQGVLSTLASNGKIGGNLLPQIAPLTPDYAHATGLSTSDAATELLKIFSDPAKGAQELTDRFALLDTAQLKHIQDLSAQDRTIEAQEVLVASAHERFQGAIDQAGFLSRALEKASKGLSDFWRGLGKQVTGPQTLEERRDALAQSIDNSTFVGSPKGFKESQVAKLADMNKQVAEQDAKAAQAGLEKQWSDIAEKADGIARGYDKVSEHSKTLADQSLSLGRGFDAAWGEYDALLRKLDQKPNDSGLRAQIKGWLDIIYQLGRAKDAVETAVGNPLTPLQRAQQPLLDERTVLASPVRERDRLRSELAAKRSLAENLSNPDTASYARQLYGVESANAGLAQQVRSRDTIADTIAEADAQDKLAAAYEKGGAAVAAQQAKNEAHSAWLKGTILDENAYAKALLERATATAQAASASAIASQRDANSGLQRIADAGGNPAAVAAATRLNEALAATKAERELAIAEKDPARIAMAQQHLDILLEEEGVRDRLSRQAQDNSADFGLEQGIERKQVEISLIGKSIEVRAHELALIEAKQALESEGWSADETGFNAELNKRQQLIEKVTQLSETEQGIQRENQRWQQASTQFAQDIGNSFENLILKGGTLKATFSSLLYSLSEMLLKLTFIDPLVQSLGGSGGKASGGILQSAATWVGNLFADGGIMTSRGSMPLNRYANGGIANSPQLAMFGEGRTPEAYVPLPDGRSIPVNVKGASRGLSQQINNNISVSVEGGSNGNAQHDAELARKVGVAIESKINTMIASQLRSAIRPGGLLNQ